jgi:hypothetical protein
MVEVILTVGLLAVVLTLAFDSFISYQNATSATAARLENLGEARVMMAALTKDLRTARTFSSLAPSDVTFLGYLNVGATAPPNQLRLYVDGQGRLLEAVTPPDDPAANPVTYTGTPRTRVLGVGVVAPGSLLSFRDAADAATTDPDEVTSVVITLSVDVPAAVDVPPTVLTSRVHLPNVAAGAAP